MPYYAIPIGEIKRFITGHGGASKDAVIAAVKQRGFDPGDDNEADALAILLCAESQNKASTQPQEAKRKTARFSNAQAQAMNFSRP